MARRYEEAKPARFVVERVDGAEQIRIPARRYWFVIAFLAFWLCGWTVGGVATVRTLLRGFDLFLLVWMGGWALGWTFAAAAIAWQLAGAEILRAANGDLEIVHRIGPLARRRLYRGVEIRDLAVAGPAAEAWGRLHGAAPPFGRAARTGSVRFTYGARTVHAAAGLDELEARMIVEHLRMRLPMSAAAGQR